VGEGYNASNSDNNVESQNNKTKAGMGKMGVINRKDSENYNKSIAKTDSKLSLSSIE